MCIIHYNGLTYEPCCMINMLFPIIVQNQSISVSQKNWHLKVHWFRILKFSWAIWATIFKFTLQKFSYCLKTMLWLSHYSAVFFKLCVVWVTVLSVPNLMLMSNHQLWPPQVCINFYNLNVLFAFLITECEKVLKLQFTSYHETDIHKFGHFTSDYFEWIK